MFNRPEWQDLKPLHRPWRPWYDTVQQNRKDASPEELEKKPWLKHQVLESAMPHDVVLDKPFYKWMSAESTKNMFLCNQGRQTFSRSRRKQSCKTQTGKEGGNDS